MTIWLWLSMVALVFFGITGITQKICTDNISFELSFVYFAIAMTVISASMAFALPLSWSGVGVREVLLIASGGFLNGLGAYTSFAAFERGGKASVVVPIINLYPLITVIGAWLFLREALTMRQLLGLLLANAAVLLLSSETPKQDTITSVI
jgi:bacterial/archaeal transporter family protein